MNHFDVKAIKREKSFFRKSNCSVFVTGRGKENVIEKVTSRYVYFRTEVSKKPLVISRKRIREAMAFLYYKRVSTRKDLEKYSRFSSALLGLIKQIFIEMSRVSRTVKGLLRLTLKGTRFIFSGVSRGVRDLEAVVEHGGRFILLNYHDLRQDKKDRWIYHVLRTGVKILLDSGSYSLYAAAQKGRQIDPITIEEYCSFIKRYQHLGVFFAYMNLDVIGNPKQSTENADYMKSKGFSPIEVWHCQSDFSELDKLVESDHELIAIGGSVFLSERERRKVFEEVFRRHPDQPFHFLGGSSKLLFEFPWFTSDSTTYLMGRRFRRLITPYGQKKAPASWTDNECLIHNIRVLSRLEEEDYQVEFPLLV